MHHTKALCQIRKLAIIARPLLALPITLIMMIMVMMMGTIMAMK